MQGDTDRLLLDNGDELKGTVRSIRPDTVEGGTSQNGAVELDAEVGPVSIELTRIVAVIFNPALWPPTMPARPTRALGRVS